MSGLRAEPFRVSNEMTHDALSGIFTFRGKIPTAHLRRVFAHGIRMAGERTRETRGGLPDLGQMYGGILRDVKRTAPDLEETLVRWGEQAVPFLADIQRFASAVETVTPEFDVDECGITQDGFVLVGVYSRERRADVRRGDAWLGGAILTADIPKGTCTVTARLVRLACTNGLVLPLNTADGVPSYERGPSGRTGGSIEETVDRSFSNQLIDRTVEALVPTAGWHVTDPVATLTQFGAALEPEAAAAVRRAFELAEDHTVYGAFNALTQTARDLLDLRKRLGLEKTAGHLVPRFARLAQFSLDGVPEAPRSSTRSPVRS